MGSDTLIPELVTQQVYAPPQLQDILSQYAIEGVTTPLFAFSMPVHVENAYLSAEGMMPAIHSLRAEIVGVRADLAQQKELFEQKLEEILLAVQHGGVTELEIEDLDDSQARARILELFKESGVSLFYDQIAEQLKLPLRQTVEICNQLELEGLIGDPSSAR
ncbi:MAG: hypothetical protein ABSE21_02155 [Bryobacteraceae bacterium]|jgi:hypothetical protein